MTGFVPVDYVFTVIIIVCAVISLIRGFIKEVFGKAAWIFGIIAGIVFYSLLSPVFQSFIKIVFICNILSFLSIFVVVFLILKIVGNIISSLCDFDIVKSLDRALGFFFGLIEGAAIVAALIFLLTLIPTGKLMAGSWYFNLFEKIVRDPGIQEMVALNV